jgi:hypothetical protein
MSVCERAAFAVRAISNQYIASRTHADGVIHANTMQTTLMARADLPLRVCNPADKLAATPMSIISASAHPRWKLIGENCAAQE